MTGKKTDLLIFASYNKQNEQWFKASLTNCKKTETNAVYTASVTIND